MMTDHLMTFLAGQLADIQAGWSVGAFGAIAEFTREPNETAELRRARDGISVVTGRGGFCIVPRPGLRLIASESPTTESWSHRVALCLRQESCAMSRRTTLTEIGPDDAALRAEDRNSVLFDLGLGSLQIDAYIRVGDPDVVAALRDHTRKSVFAPGNEVMSIILAANPHRVFVSQIGRAEVYQHPAARSGKAPMARTPMSCRNYWRMVAPTRRRSRCRKAGFPARMSIRRIRCAISSAGSARSDKSIMQPFRSCSNVMGWQSW